MYTLDIIYKEVLTVMVEPLKVPDNKKMTFKHDRPLIDLGLI